MDSKDIRYILDNIISKAQINKQTGKYKIQESDYLNLNLSTNQLKLLKKICQNLDIKLEYIGYTRMLLPCTEDEELFQEYNRIKSTLESITDPEEKNKLEQRRILIRNKIAIDNIPLVESIINRRLDGIKDAPNKEDIYQTGYETLIEYLDKNYLDKKTFKDYISKVLLLYVTRKLSSVKENYQNNTNSTRNTIRKNASPEQDNEISSLNIRYYDDSFEEIIIDTISKKQIISKIISTLPQLEQTILKLYFGFNGTSYNMPEIANMYGLSKSRISMIINDTLDSIKNSLRIKYLNEIYNTKMTYQCEETLSNKKLEEFLIKRIPNDILDEMLKEYKQKSKEFAKLYFSDKDYSTKEMSEILNTTPSYINLIKTKIILEIRNRIIESISTKENRTITYEEYLDYLMKFYLHNKKVKRRVK